MRKAFSVPRAQVQRTAEVHRTWTCPTEFNLRTGEGRPPLATLDQSCAAAATTSTSVTTAPPASCTRPSSPTPTAPIPLVDAFTRVQLLVLDDWLRDPLTRLQSQDLLDILDDRYGRSSTLVATQVPVAEWHVRFPDPTIGDAILDRLVHNAYRLALKGESRRRIASPLPMPTT
jgi:hypothetical protein